MVAQDQREQRGPSRLPTVLVVDDVPLARMLIAEHLRKSGFLVVEVSNGDEAVRVLQADVPIDVVMSDVYIPAPAMDGPTLARWIRSHRPGLKILLGSGVVSEVDPELADLYAGPLLSKPYRLDELERRLREAVGDLPATPDQTSEKPS